MALTLADALRQTGYAKDGQLQAPAPTQPNLSTMAADYLRQLPEKTAQNAINTNKMVQGVFPTDPFGKPNPDYYPEAMSEFANFVPNLMGATAFHGTPHKIKGLFDISKVGTGEGAQAYGHGMYFAEAPSVAETYKRAGGGLEIKYAKPLEEIGINPKIASHSMDFDENPVNQGLGRIAKSLRTTALDYPDVPLDQKLVKEHFDEYIRLLEDKYPKEAAQKKALQDLVAKEGYPDINFGGNLYKVDIPDADIPMMMDLDKPLSQQPKVMGALRLEAEQRVKDKTLVNIENDIRSSLPPIDIGNDYMAMFSDANVKAGQEIKKQALKKLNNMNLSSLVDKELESMKPLAMNWNMTGKEYYEFLSKNQGSPAKASEMLQRQGITGNRYLDEVSRNRGQGTSNFVVFEPSTVKILEENGIPTRKELIQQQIDKIE
jgi:hypothetical protein